jgi:hypothetical protein
MVTRRFVTVLSRPTPEAGASPLVERGYRYSHGSLYANLIGHSLVERV